MSATILECLKYAIGISRLDCPCYEDDMQADVTQSESGLYLLETEGLEIKSLASLTDCSNGGLWALAEWARSEAIQSVVDDLMASIAMNADPVAIQFNGLIGETKNNAPVVSGYPYHAYRMLTRRLKGGYIKGKRMGLIFQETKTFDLVLYDNLTSTALGQWVVTSQAGKVKWFTFPSPVILPMTSPDSTENLRYEFVYINDGTFSAMNNSVNCGCGGASHYNEISPRFERTKDMWSEWINVTGAKGTDFNDRINGWTENSEANGLVLDAEIYCDAGKTICNETINFKADPLAKILAWAFRFRGAMFLTSRLLSSKEPNRFTTAGREQMAANYETYDKQANARIATLAQEWSRPGMITRYSDCFTCRPWGNLTGIRA